MELKDPEQKLRIEPTAPIEDYPCPQCGAALRFDPQAQALGCGHCGYSRAIDPDADARLIEQDYAQAVRRTALAAETEEVRALSCESCGASTTLDPLAHATQCPFCAAPLVDVAGARRQIAAQGVLPFGVAEREARAAMKKWIGNLWFAPNDLVSGARAGGPLTGVYLPFWTFDADTRSSYRGARGDAYYVDRWVTEQKDGRSVRRKRRERRIRWTSVSGHVARFFDDVLILASKGLPNRLARRLEGGAYGERIWDLQAMEPYQPDYLAGFRAELYAIDLEAGYASAKAVMDLEIRQDVRRDIGGDAQRISSVHTERRDVSFKHVLLPVWIAAYRYRGKPYRFVVNGRTGEVIGERPYSWWKIALAAVLAAAAIGGIIAALWASGALDP
ncbi:MAG: primosomal protein N' (replication factor Y) - superfamily II helicase [Neomegalonema sp.]|nr:primosomal protein N' (replication factor Y) - superfamily II helicase [Neomegalonema sp.]